MRALAPLFREARIKFYQWALHDMSPLHPDLPAVVHRLHQLVAERPPIEQRPRSRCEESPGMCAGDPRCPDTHCPGRLHGLHHTDGGHTFSYGVVFPIEHRHQAIEPTPQAHLVRDAAVVLLLHAALCAAAIALGVPLSLPF